MTFAWPDGNEVAITVTFDDARESQLRVAQPLLDEYGIKGSFYAVPNAVKPRAERWTALAEAGHEIGNHTVNHPCSANFKFARANAVEEYTLDRMEQELLDCNKQLEELCGVRPETYAYPCGHTFVGRGLGHTSYVPLVARHFIAGRAYPSEWHNAPWVCDFANLNGIPFDKQPFESVLPLIDRAREDKGWLILVGHDAGEGENYPGISSRVLRALCEYARSRESRVWMDTTVSVAKYIAEQRSKAENAAST